jgi:hypothetical protein
MVAAAVPSAKSAPFIRGKIILNQHFRTSDVSTLSAAVSINGRKENALEPGRDLLPAIRRKVYMILRNEEECHVEGKA